MPLIADPTEAFGRYMGELRSEYLSWYQSAIKVNSWGWQIAQGVGLAASFAAAVLAALWKEQTMMSFETIRVWLIVLPLIASFASSILVQLRPREIMLLRDAGREAIQNLIADAEARYPAIASDPAAISLLHQELVARVSAIEQSQTAEFAKTSAPTQR
jgi:hypothetical protein